MDQFSGSRSKADPRFVSTDGYYRGGPDGIWLTADDGLRLQAASPCIDAADGSAAPATDILGQPRYDYPPKFNTGSGTPAYADIGAYEYQPQ